MVHFPRILTLVLAGGLLALGCRAQGPEKADTLPGIGARVRVMAPQLGEGWHIGMFNQLRVVPACYVIVLFEPESRRIRAMLRVPDLARIQLSALDEQTWRDVPLEALREADRNCRVAP